MSVLSVRAERDEAEKQEEERQHRKQEHKEPRKKYGLLRYPWVMVSRLFLKSLEQTVL